MMPFMYVTTHKSNLYWTVGFLGWTLHGELTSAVNTALEMLIILRKGNALEAHKGFSSLLSVYHYDFQTRTVWSFMLIKIRENCSTSMAKKI